MATLLPTGTTVANGEIIVSVGSAAAYHMLLINESAAAMHVELDNTASPGSEPCATNGTVERRGMFHTVHIYSDTASVNVNSGSSGGIYLAVDVV